MKPRAFVPTVAQISASEAGKVPGLEAVVSYWTEGTYSAQGWFRELNELWGPSGFVMRRGEDVLGFAVYGPPEYLPHAGRYPVGPLSEDAALLAYVEGEEARARRHLLVRVLRDLKHRGVGGVEAVAADLPVARHVSTGTLLENGWRPVRRGWYRGRPYTLARTDLGSAVEVGELARGLIGRVKLPKLGSPSPAPGAFVQNRVKPVMARCGAAGSRS